MQESCCREEYPASIVVVSNLLSFLIWGIGAYILSRFSIIVVIAYLLGILVLELRLLGRHCVDCYYYKKTCAFGKGRLSALFFPRGDPERFLRMQITGKDIVPDFLVFLIPVLAGVLLLIQAFSWGILFLVIALVILGFAGNALVRGNLACRYCKQREIGCPAEKLFDEKPGR